MAKYYVYMIKCEKWKKGIFQRELYYTGMTTNVKKRLGEHRAGIKSNWMVGNNIIPRELVYVELVGGNYWERSGRLRKNMAKCPDFELSKVL